MAACWFPCGICSRAMRCCASARCTRHCCSPRSACSGLPRPSSWSTTMASRNRRLASLHWLARWALWRHRLRAGWQILAIRASPRYLAMIAAVISFLPGLVGGADGVYWLALTGVVLDFAVQMNMVLGQRAIYALDATSRGRLNALYMTAIFAGGAVGIGRGQRALHAYRLVRHRCDGQWSCIGIAACHGTRFAPLSGSHSSSNHSSTRDIIMTSHLFSPITIGQLKLTHRVAMAPLTRSRAAPAR